MEYATIIYDAPVDDNFVKHVGYSQYVCQEDCGVTSSIGTYFSQNTVDTISYKVTQLLAGVDPQNRPIIVPDKTITSVMSAVWDNYKPQEAGDIYTRYNIPTGLIPDGVTTMIDQTINLIVTDVSVNIGIEEHNKNLTIWSTVLGDFNKQGLRSHSKIKLREKRPQPMLFNLNY
jgi:hypothetical protein